MTYIKLEDVIEIMQSEIDRLRGSSTLEGILERINSLPSINPEEMIEKELDKIKEAEKNPIDENFPYYLIRITLQELLQRFKS